MDTSSIPNRVGNGSVKKESLLTISETEIGSNYDSDHDVFDLSFCTVEMMSIPIRVKNRNELNMEGLGKMFGQDNSLISKS